MLIGQFDSKLTDKDRISVPKKIRQELGDDLIVARWYENCLVMVSVDNWSKLLGRLVGQNNLITSPVRDIDRFILAGAFEMRLDNQGRFVVPEILKTYADIKTEVTFVGLADRVEIWSSQKWLELEKASENKAAIAIEKIATRQNS